MGVHRKSLKGLPCKAEGSVLEARRWMSKAKVKAGVLLKKQMGSFLLSFHFIQPMCLLGSATHTLDGSSILSKSMQSHVELC